MKRLLVAVTALMLLPAVLLGAALGALSGGSEATMLVVARGSAGLAVAAAQAGFTGQGLRLAVAVGLAESGGNPAARGPNPPTPGCPAGSTDRGAWQLNTCYHPEVADACADDLACAAKATYRISAAAATGAPGPPTPPAPTRPSSPPPTRHSPPSPPPTRSAVSRPATARPARAGCRRPPTTPSTWSPRCSASATSAAVRCSPATSQTAPITPTQAARRTPST